jgi:hypothetical protein
VIRSGLPQALAVADTEGYFPGTVADIDRGVETLNEIFRRDLSECSVASEIESLVNDTQVLIVPLRSSIASYMRCLEASGTLGTPDSLSACPEEKANVRRDATPMRAMTDAWAVFGD